MVASPYPWETTGAPLPLCWPGFELAALGSRTVASLCLGEAWGQRTKALTRLRSRPARSHSRAKGEDGRRDGLPDGAPGETPACGWEALRCGFGPPAAIPHRFAVPRKSYRGSDTTPRARQVTRLPLASGR